MKIRPVDHFSWSNVATRSRKRIKLNSVNGMTEVPEAIKHDHLDDLVASMTLLRRFVLLMFLSPHPPIIHICICCCVRLTGETPALWKLDVDSAFRRIPFGCQSHLGCRSCFQVQGHPLCVQAPCYTLRCYLECLVMGEGRCSHHTHGKSDLKDPGTPLCG